MSAKMILGNLLLIQVKAVSPEWADRKTPTGCHRRML
jgi:hypothetical protein